MDRGFRHKSDRELAKLEAHIAALVGKIEEQQRLVLELYEHVACEQLSRAVEAGRAPWMHRWQRTVDVGDVYALSVRRRDGLKKTLELLSITSPFAIPMSLLARVYDRVGDDLRRTRT